ncbi:hypothetical protein Ciccas_007420 [Cichlidogyrus casuarinus]|uniref:Uncharacterized protein n=1 Tax=Cichlidogyrus casuarinus TaxID=1844966 RepID=A0ABD2Q441_9PLAT
MLNLETDQKDTDNVTDIIGNLTGKNSLHPLTRLLAMKSEENPDSTILEILLLSLEEFVSKGNKETSVQVDEDCTDLSVALGTIDHVNSLTKSRIVSELKQKFDSELAKFKSNLQQSYQFDLSSRIDALRKGEILKLRAEFDAQLENELSRRERSVIERYETKLKSLQMEQRNFDENRTQILKSENSDLFLRRQLLEAQASELATKHREVEKELLRVSTLQSEMDDRMKERVNRIDQMRTELEQDKKSFELKVMNRVEEIRLAERSATLKEKANLANEIEVLEQEREGVAIKFRTAQKRLKEANELKAKFEEMADTDYQSLQNENNLLKSENKNLKTRLNSTLEELEKERQQKAQIESHLVVKTKAASQVDKLRHELEQEKLSKMKEIADLSSSTTELKMTIETLRNQLSTCKKMKKDTSQSAEASRRVDRGMGKTIEETKQRLAELDQQSLQLDREFRKWSMMKSLPIDLGIDFDDPQFLDLQSDPYAEYLQDEVENLDVEPEKKADPEQEKSPSEKPVILDSTLNFSLEDTLPEKETTTIKPQKVSFASFISTKDEEDSPSNSNDFFD